jgi:hypothetical protein
MDSVSKSRSGRLIMGRLSVIAGNTLQIAGMAGGCVALWAARSSPSPAAAAVEMILGWVLFYFFCHGIAHWAAGRMVGIRLAYYTVGGTGNPEGYPPGMRWVFEHLPFLGVQTQKASMQRASARGKAIMWSAGVTSSAMVPALSSFWAWRMRIPGSAAFLVFAVFWALGTVASNWRSRTGDYAKARRALGGI